MPYFKQIQMDGLFIPISKKLSPFYFHRVLFFTRNVTRIKWVSGGGGRKVSFKNISKLAIN